MSRLAFAVALLVAPVAQAGEPTPAQVLQKYTDMMSPKTFDALVTMTAHRQDGSERGYKFRAMKGDGDKVRLWFYEPAAAKGQEMLRVEENMWVYMPNLKRAIRLASRESFQGGDFNNADALRVNYVADYTPSFAPGAPADVWILELSAKTKEAAYDKIKLWIHKGDFLPQKGEYYAASGKMLRSMEFSEVKDFRGLRRPARLKMRNETATQRWSEMYYLDMKLDLNVPAQKFVLDDLGR